MSKKTQGGGLYGYVKDRSGEPCVGALIKVTGSALQGVMVAATDMDGQWIIPFLPAGPYVIEAEDAEGCCYARDCEDVALGETRKVGLHLRLMEHTSIRGREAERKPAPESKEKSAYMTKAEEMEAVILLAGEICKKDRRAGDLVEQDLDRLKGMAGMAGPVYIPIFVTRAAGARLTQISAELEAAFESDC